MNRNSLIAAGLFALLNAATLTAHAATAQPDIQHVVSITENGSTGCGIVNARLTYLDPQGHTQVLHYKKFAENCPAGS